MKNPFCIGLLSLLTIALSISFAAQASAQSEWPRWGGPNGDFKTERADWSVDWPEDGLKQVWKSEIGTGFSSVAVRDGLLYTMGRKGGDDVIYCINAESGDTVWDHQYPAPIFNNLHEGGPGATPTLDGEFVYTLSRNGALTCFVAKDGDVKWKQNVAEMTGMKPPEWGLTASPLIVDDMVVLEVGRVIALNKLSGEEIWQTEKKYKPGYGTPSVTILNEQKLIATLNNEVLQLIKADDGSVVATHPWKTQFATSAATPLIHEDTFFVSTGYGSGCTLLKFAAGEFTEIYKSKKLANHMNPSLLKDGMAFGIHGNSHNARVCAVVCIDHATGEEKWKHRGYGCGSLIIAGNRLLILSDRGQLVCAKATDTDYEELASAKILDGKCWTIPVLVGNRVYARDAKGDLVCVELP